MSPRPILERSGACLVIAAFILPMLAVFDIDLANNEKDSLYIFTRCQQPIKDKQTECTNYNKLFIKLPQEIIVFQVLFIFSTVIWVLMLFCLIPGLEIFNFAYQPRHNVFNTESVSEALKMKLRFTKRKMVMTAGIGYTMSGILLAAASGGYLSAVINDFELFKRRYELHEDKQFVLEEEKDVTIGIGLVICIMSSAFNFVGGLVLCCSAFKLYGFNDDIENLATELRTKAIANDTAYMEKSKKWQINWHYDQLICLVSIVGSFLIGLGTFSEQWFIGDETKHQGEQYYGLRGKRRVLGFLEYVHKEDYQFMGNQAFNSHPNYYEFLIAVVSFSITSTLFILLSLTCLNYEFAIDKSVILPSRPSLFYKVLIPHTRLVFGGISAFCVGVSSIVIAAICCFKVPESIPNIRSKVSIGWSGIIVFLGGIIQLAITMPIYLEYKKQTKERFNITYVFLADDETVKIPAIQKNQVPVQNPQYKGAFIEPKTPEGTNDGHVPEENMNPEERPRKYSPPFNEEPQVSKTNLFPPVSESESMFRPLPKGCDYTTLNDIGSNVKDGIQNKALEYQPNKKHPSINNESSTINSSSSNRINPRPLPKDSIYVTLDEVGSDVMDITQNKAPLPKYSHYVTLNAIGSDGNDVIQNKTPHFNEEHQVSKTVSFSSVLDRAGTLRNDSITLRAIGSDAKDFEPGLADPKTSNENADGRAVSTEMSQCNLASIMRDSSPEEDIYVVDPRYSTEESEIEVLGQMENKSYASHAIHAPRKKLRYDGYKVIEKKTDSRGVSTYVIQ